MKKIIRDAVLEKFERKRTQEKTILSSRDNIHVTSEVKNAIAIFKNLKLDIADCIIAAHSLKGSLASFDSELLDIEGVNVFWK